jgi:hypothetical protein
MQFIHIKKTRLGIKTYILYESESRHVWNTTIYCCKTTRLKGSEHLGSASNVARALSEEILDKGYKTTSTPAWKCPFYSKTGSNGTIQKNRSGLPRTLTGMKLTGGKTGI